MPRRAILPLLLAAWAAGALPADEKQGRPMDATVMMLMEKVAGLADAVYFRRDAEAISALPGDAALAGFQGVLLGAPRRVDLTRESGTTALVLTGLTSGRMADLPFHRNAILVAADIDRGTVFAGPAFVPDPSKSPEPPEPPEAAPAPLPPPLPAGVAPLPEASSGGTAWLDVPQLLNLPRRDMRLALRLIYFDQVSNAAAVEQTGDAAPAPAPAAADALALVARLRAAGQSQHRLPVFKRGPDTPVLDRPGAAFVLGRIGAPLPLHAALRIELSPAMVVQPAPPAAATAEVSPPSAVLRAAVLVVMRDRNEPHLFPIEIPVWSPAPLAPGQTIDAAFSIDLATLLPPAAMQPGARVYLLAGRHIAGPQALAR